MLVLAQFKVDAAAQRKENREREQMSRAHASGYKPILALDQEADDLDNMDDDALQEMFAGAAERI